ncbi:phage tail protein [Vibrio quintilis]|uniref:Phage tail protein (Tail_P2_I) n=1 Tax=Vibrio quintilis TaxID=1117707 RepID=A0A1M7YYY7_9VIBR|nr:phage tail protein [Vibrio quintilis]SHO57899.1 hypothetical protein VQ7734_03669 [Vibrio quintilis]
MTDKNIPELPESVIPWWQDGNTTSEETKEPYFLSSGVYRFFQRVRDYLLFPLRQTDALTCSESVLNLLAWDRDIQRFDDEPLSLFRKRVKFAAINARDAGSVAGFKRIFARLGIGIVSFKERTDAVQWDVCTIEVTDNDMTDNKVLMMVLIRQYGRTCRRYRFEVTYKSELNIEPGEFSHRFSIDSASITEAAEISVFPAPVEHQQQLFIASLGDE